jgi:microcystin-dependent protein
MEYFVGEIIPFAGDFAPDGSLECMGQVLPALQYQALYALIGNTYGGSAGTTFALPDLRGRLAMGVNPGQAEMGSTIGSEMVTLNQAQMPAHNHALVGSTAMASSTSIGGNTVLASTPANLRPYADITKPISNTQQLDSRVVGSAGGSQPHTNVMPTSCVRYAICYQGYFPAFQ